MGNRDHVRVAIQLLREVAGRIGRQQLWQAERVADEEPQPLPPVVTRVPSKWVFVDLETGDAWLVGSDGRWKSLGDLEPEIEPEFTRSFIEHLLDGER